MLLLNLYGSPSPILLPSSCFGLAIRYAQAEGRSCSFDKFKLFVKENEINPHLGPCFFFYRLCSPNASQQPRSHGALHAALLPSPVTATLQVVLSLDTDKAVATIKGSEYATIATQMTAGKVRKKADDSGGGPAGAQGEEEQ